MPTRSCAAFSALILAALVFTGCTSRTVRDDAVMLDIAGPVAVEVESFNGDVNVYVDEKLEQAEVQIVRESNFGIGRSGEAVDALDDIHYTAQVESGPSGPVLRVRTWTDWPEPYLQAAHVTINLPGVNELSVHTTRGRVYAVDVQGPVDISTTEGDVRLMTNWAMLEPVTIRNDRGDIDYRVRGESTAMVTAETTDGRVLHDCRYSRLRIREHTDRRLVVQINEGQNPVDLHTVEGDIRVAVINNPTEVGIFIIDP